MGRSTKKGPYIDERLLNKIILANEQGKKKPIKTWARNSTISPDFVGHTISIHNGKAFMSVFMTESMVGHKLGEFAPTRVFRGHSGSKKK